MFTAQLLQAGLGYGPAAAGLALVPWTATLMVIAPVAGVLADRIGNRPVLIAALAAKAAGLAALALVATPDASYWLLLEPFVFAGVGSSAALPVVQSCVLGAVPGERVGTAWGANSAVQEFGGALGVAALVAVFAAVARPGRRHIGSGRVCAASGVSGPTRRSPPAVFAML